jgi:hypothetical protein
LFVIAKSSAGTAAQALISLKPPGAILGDKESGSALPKALSMPPLAQPVTPLRCELCGGPMKLVRRLSAPDAALRMALYQCEHCRHTMTRSVEDDER